MKQLFTHLIDKISSFITIIISLVSSDSRLLQVFFTAIGILSVIRLFKSAKDIDEKAKTDETVMQVISVNNTW